MSNFLLSAASLLNQSSPSFALPLRLRSSNNLLCSTSTLTSVFLCFPLSPPPPSGGDFNVESSGCDLLPMNGFCMFDALAACFPALPVQYEMCTVEWQHP